MKKDIYKMYTDGASRGNPGLSGIGFVIYKNEEIIKEGFFFIGKETNNKSEYLALIIGLLYAKKFEIKNLKVYMDSLLLQKQVMGLFKVKNNNIKKCYNLVKKILSFINIEIEHIERGKNKHADMLANKAIDEKKKMPDSIFNKLIEFDCISKEN